MEYHVTFREMAQKGWEHRQMFPTSLVIAALGSKERRKACQ